MKTNPKLQKLAGLALVYALTAFCAPVADGQTLSFLRNLLPERQDHATAIFDDSGLYSISGSKIQKHDLAGELLWSRDGNPSDYAIKLASNAAGIFAVGFTGGSATGHAFLRLYDHQGNQVWSRESSDFINAVAADGSGVYIGEIGPVALVRTLFIRKYDDRGVELWTKQLEERNATLALMADATGLYVHTTYSFNKYLADGSKVWTQTFDGPNPAYDMKANATGIYLSNYYFLEHYSLGGSLLWKRPQSVGSIALHANDVYLTTSTRQQLGQCASGFDDLFTVRYDSEGTTLWSRQYGTVNWDRPSASWADSSGVFVAGGGLLAKLEADLEAATTSGPRILNECVVNAASFVGGAVSPGEIVAIFGANLGPSQPMSATGEGGFETTLAEARVLFDGVLAPLLYVSAGQVNVVVPNSVAKKASVGIQVEYRGIRSQTVTVPVQSAHLGIFTVGADRPAVLNQDGTLNSRSNPAKRGSIVAIYATGGGLTTPETRDGGIVGNPPPRLALPLKVDLSYPAGIEELSAPGEVTYAGFVTGTVAGLLQVNVRLPEFITSHVYLMLHIQGVSGSPELGPIYITDN